MVIDKHKRGLMSPCNRCKKIESFEEHSCKHYHGTDKIPPEIFSGKTEECEHFDEEEKWKEDTTSH